MNFATENLVFDPQIIRRFDVNGPRYTSYPTADRFVEAFDSQAAKLWLGKRNIGGISRPLSLYFPRAEVQNVQYQHAGYDEALGEGEGQPQALSPADAGPKIGRNDPCPCGSGKKYKHCHGKLS